VATPCFQRCLLATAMVATLPLAQAANAQSDSSVTGAVALEEILVTGTRATVRNRMEIKKNAISVVDGLSATDIGDLPALSIGEALESITGVSSHRENGGATEVSIRGLGPFLSATTFNGREATNGSGDRSVNFSQFPSELMSKIAVYKTQNASLIEGGVAGLIQLETLKPLEYDKRRIQAEVKGNYNPDQQNIADSREGDLGYRGTFSYVDQFSFDNGSEFGLSLGFQKSDISQPEQEVRSSSPSGSSIYACLNDPLADWEGFYSPGDNDCEDQKGADAPYDPDGDGDFTENNQGYVTAIDPATGKAYSDGLAYAFAPSSRGYRQNDTSDERDAVFVALQWQPSEDWDINFDMQLSERVQAEQRHDLNFANQKRSTDGVTAPGLVTTASGAIVEWFGETAIESNSEVYSRAEDYKGFGLSVAHNLTDRLTVSADYGFSETTREELQVSLRTQSDNEDIFDVDTAAGYRPLVHWDRYSGIPQYTITDFDVNDHTLFSDEYRARIDSDVDRTNTVNAFRGDFQLELEGDFFTSVEGGMRLSQLEYLNLGGTRYTTPNLDDSSQAERDAIVAINQACANTAFPESGFLSSQADGALITTVDSATGAETTTNSWATFDTMCVTNMILDFHGEEFAYPDQVRVSPSTTDVTETTQAGYVMANFDGQVSNQDIRGNLGLRVVHTEVESTAYRTEYEIVTDSSGFLSMQTVAGADLEKISVSDSYTELLPSLNVVVDLSDDVILRGGIFRGLSRPDPSDLGYNRSFRINGADDIVDADDLITGVSASGNPATGPLTSWNFDASWEWYANEDSMLSVGLYHKKFTGGFEQVAINETFTVDGEQITAEVMVRDTIDDTSNLTGIEVSSSHRFSYLPGAFEGLGIKVSYNYADSDFKFEDENYGNVSVRNLDGSYTQTKAGIIAPGNIPGFSEHVFSGQLYYQIGNFDSSLIYKYRSEYFQPYTSNGNRLRYVGDVGVWEARASYKINDTFSVKIEAINLFDEPKKQYFYVRDNLGEVNVYGPRVFVGLKAKF